MSVDRIFQSQLQQRPCNRIETMPPLSIAQQRSRLRQSPPRVDLQVLHLRQDAASTA